MFPFKILTDKNLIAPACVIANNKSVQCRLFFFVCFIYSNLHRKREGDIKLQYVNTSLSGLCLLFHYQQKERKKERERERERKRKREREINRE